MATSESPASLSALGALELDPRAVACLEGRVRRAVLDALIRWEAFGDLLACTTELLDRSPGLLTLQDDRARALHGLGHHEEALAQVRARLAVAPSISAQAREARILMALGRHREALERAHELIEARADSASAWVLHGDVHLARHELTDARAAYTWADELTARGRAGEGRPSDAGAARGRAYLLGMLGVYEAQGDLVTASGYAAQLERAGEAAPLPAYVLRRLCDYYARSGEAHHGQRLEAILAASYAADLARLSAMVGSAERGPLSGPRSGRPRGARPRDAEQAPVETGPALASPLPFSPEEERHIVSAARRLFGFDTLLPGQCATMLASLAGRDVLTILPTGGGKSLCYQLPAFEEESGTTLVISPLIALMKDQVDSLPAPLAARAVAINSSLDGDSLRACMDDVAAGAYRLVYAAPERLRQTQFLHALRRAPIRRLVVDEAHCISMWGHDFRPDYLWVSEARRLLGDPPLLAMTATAPPRVREDIVRRMAMGGPDGSGAVQVVGDPYRSNLYLAVRICRNHDEKLATLLDLCAAEQGSAIVYVASRQRAEQLAALLCRHGTSAAYYHAGITDPVDRAGRQEAFMGDRVQVMVATIAFGMGIDKPDIRLIVHYDPANSLESYYQETGRAGRDGRPARCVLLYASADRGTLTRRRKRDAIPIEALRDLYAVLRQRLAGRRAGRLAIGDLSRDCREDDTRVRVALGLLEEAALIRRGADLPRIAIVRAGPAWAEAVADPTERWWRDLAQHTGLVPGATCELDLLRAAEALGVAPPDLLWRLLEGADRRIVWCRPIGRDAYIEMLPTDAGASERVPALLEAYEAAHVQRVDELVRYAQAFHCRHAHIGGFLTGVVRQRCDACDHCVPRATPDPTRVQLPSEGGQLAIILSAVASSGWGCGRMRLIRALCGVTAKDECGTLASCWASLSFRSPAQVRQMVERLLVSGLIGERALDHGGQVLEITPLGREALRSREPISAER